MVLDVAAHAAALGEYEAAAPHAGMRRVFGRVSPTTSDRTGPESWTVEVTNQAKDGAREVYP